MSQLAVALLTLVLVAVTPSAKTRTVQPKQRTAAASQTQQDSSISSPTPTQTSQPTATIAAPVGTNYNQSYYCQPDSGGNVPAWLQAIATILLVVFAFWQMRFIRDSVTATQEAARAARDNAAASQDAANAALAQLRGHRPLVVVHGFKLTMRPQFLSPINVTFVIENAGMLPGILEVAIGHCEIWPVDKLPAVGDFSRCQAIPVFKTVLMSRDPQTVTVPYENELLTQSQHNDVFDKHTSRLIVYGQLRYKTLATLAAEESFDTPFLWIWQDRVIGESKTGEQEFFGCFQRGPEDHNRQT